MGRDGRAAGRLRPNSAAPAAAPAAPPPAEVGVVVATPGNVGVVTELPGRTEASRVAQVDYTVVTAPISGRIGRAQVTEGALVGQGEATPLATIQQLDPIYVNLTPSERLLLRQAMSPASAVGRDQASVSLATDGTPYPQTGKLLFSEAGRSDQTGVTLRAEFPNPDRFLLPGMYVRARRAGGQRSAITVPQQAVSAITMARR